MLVSDNGTKSHDPPPIAGTWQVNSSMPQVSQGNSLGAAHFSQPSPNQGRPANVPVPTPSPPVFGTYERPTHQPMGTPTKVAYGLIIAVMCASGIAILISHFDKKKPGVPSQSVSSSSTTVPIASTSTPTTVQELPIQLSPSAASSAAMLVSSWADGDRTAALAVATPSAVATIFAVPYPRGLAIDRGCSVAFSPIVCTYGPPGGASPNDAIFEIDVTQASGGWYVSAVKVEN